MFDRIRRWLWPPLPPRVVTFYGPGRTVRSVMTLADTGAEPEKGDTDGQ